MFRTEVSIQAILYIAENITRRDIHKICKILYFADQMHLSRYGRSITGDDYIAMQYGPVPSRIEDIFKAMRGDSFFSDRVESIKQYFVFKNKYTIEPLVKPNMDYLSESDKECLDYSIKKCKDKTFDQLTEMSHDIAWSITERDRKMSVKDILREIGDSEDYATYIDMKLRTEQMAVI